jgi:hypothetical protein
MKTKMNKAYIEEYDCGCSSVERYRKNLLGYCKVHGQDARHVHVLFGIDDDKLKYLKEE